MGKNKGRRPGGGGNADQFNNCEAVNIDGLLASQQPKAMAFVKEESVVTLELVSHGQRDIVEVKLHGAFLGTLFANDLDKLIDCMKKGYPFFGVVTEISGARCVIWVQSGKPTP